MHVFFTESLNYCPPPFRRKAEGYCFRLSVVRGALQKSIGSRYLVPLTPPTVLSDPFETLHWLLGWPEDMHLDFSES